MRIFYSGMNWTPNPEITKKCPDKTGFAVHSKLDSLSSQFRNQCPVQIGIGVQYTPDFATFDKSWLYELIKKSDIMIRE